MAPGSAREAWTVITEHPTAPRNPARQHRLRGSLATRWIDGKQLDQWQYEVTGAGRIWYCPDSDRRIAWLVLAATGHPKATE